MDSEVVELFNGIGLGTGLLLIIFIGSTVFLIIDKVRKMKAYHKDQILEENKKEEKINDLTDKVNKLCESVESLTAFVNKITERLDKDDEVIKEIDTSYKNTSTLITNEVLPQMKLMDKSITDLSNSSMADIRSFIVNEYHKWMKAGYIDVYSMSVIQDKFEYYSKHNGNTYVADLVSQLYKLQSKSVIVNDNGQDPIDYFSRHPEHHPKNRKFPTIVGAEKDLYNHNDD